MKKLLYSFLLLICTHGFSQKKFSLEGNVSGLKETVSRAFLYYRSGGESITDSVEIKGGKYSFVGKLQEPVLARIRAVYPDLGNGKKRAISFKKDFAVVFLEPSDIKVSHADSFANASVTGSKAHIAYLSLEEATKEISVREEALSNKYSALYEAKDEEGMKEMEKQFEMLGAERKKIYKNYLENNPKSPIALYALSQFAGWDINPEEVEPLFSLLPASAQALPTGKDLQEKIEVAKKTGVGRIAMDFTQNDTLGNPVKLSAFRGKYLLIDFWASWCGPCRKENPNVVKAFNKYKEKRFHILGVSLDQPNGKDKWINAIHEDNLTWTQVSDLKFWKNAVAVQYGIQAIPQNFLVDPEGKIIAKNLSGDELDKKLSELIKK